MSGRQVRKILKPKQAKKIKGTIKDYREKLEPRYSQHFR